jgi:hypothetical protein
VAAILPSAALAGTPDPSWGSPWPQDSQLEYRWASGAVPPSILRNAISDGAADATSTRASRAPAFTYDSSAANDISYGPDNPCGVNGLACVWRNPPTGFDLWFRENGHRYDWGTLRWCEMTGSPSGCFSGETLALDELGHVDGLDHHVNLPDGSDFTDAVVQGGSHAKPDAGWSVHEFGVCDVATLQQLYDVAAWTTPYSTCLDVPTTLSLAMTPAGAASGTVVFTSALRTAGSGRLSGNPVSGRRAVLQWRSGLDWVDLVALAQTASAGVYTASVQVRSGTSYRVVFRATPSEGLRGATSAMVASGGSCTGICVLGPTPARVANRTGAR